MLKLAMSLKIQTPKDIESLKKIILSSEKLLFSGSKTSTVIPFDRVVEGIEGIDSVVDLSCLEPIMSLDENGDVSVSGAVSWSDLRKFLNQEGREVGCWPTDQSALVLSGLATSATGERCFSRGTIREHVSELTYLDSDGEQRTLSSSKLLGSEFSSYQSKYKKFQNFKNAPFPRFLNETDLLIGTEGQLGVILSAKLKTFELVETQYILMPIESWISNKAVNQFISWSKQLSYMLSLEFFDKNCIELCKNSNLSKDSDYIVFEVPESKLEDFTEKLYSLDESIDLERLIILDEKTFLEFRVSIPRGVNELISRRRLVKKGTDAQVTLDNFQALLDLYRDMSTKGIDFVLFGHLGDCHLHFNFLPKDDQIDLCDQILEEFYDKLLDLEGSPFAEHGIGLIKKKYIARFYSEEVVNTFKRLKQDMDPKGSFFPIGFMGDFKS